MIASLIRYIIIKSFCKKMILSTIVSVLAYFGFEELSILKSAAGVTEYEVAQQIDIEALNTVMESTRILKYRISNVGSMPIGLRLMVGTPNIKPEFRVGAVFKIYSNTVDPRLIKVTPYRPYTNRLILTIEDLRPGLGLEIIFPDNLNNLNYIDQLNIKMNHSSIPNLFRHTLNRSPISIMIARYLWLFFYCFSLSFILYSLFSRLREFFGTNDV